jgi:hypothetical protein
MRKKIAAVGVAAGSVALGTVAVVGTSAASPAASPSASSPAAETFFITQSDHKQVAVAHGVFTAGGIDRSRGQRDILHLGNGKVVIKHPNKDAVFTPTLDKSTCFVSFTLTGKYTIARGTGAYKGVTGDGTYAGEGQEILKKKANGHCNRKAKPVVQADDITAKGTATLPSSS